MDETGPENPARKDAEYVRLSAKAVLQTSLDQTFNTTHQPPLLGCMRMLSGAAVLVCIGIEKEITQRLRRVTDQNRMVP